MSASGTIGRVNVGGNDYLVASTSYGTCATAAGTVAKVATIQDSAAFTLLSGVTVHIKFTYANTASNPTLNVNSTGAKSIYRFGTTVPGTTANTSWYAGSVVSFTYDGTNWIMNDINDNITAITYTLLSGTDYEMTITNTAEANYASYLLEESY